MQSADMPLEAETGWDIDWRAPGTWARLLLVSLQLFIIISMTPIFVAALAGWAWSAGGKAQGDFAASLGMLLVIIQIAGLNAVIGIRFGMHLELIKQGSLQDRLLLLGWGLVFAIATFLLTGEIGETLGLGYASQTTVVVPATLASILGLGYIVAMLRRRPTDGSQETPRGLSSSNPVTVPPNNS